jgi:hypothetical protein
MNSKRWSINFKAAGIAAVQGKNFKKLQAMADFQQ